MRGLIEELRHRNVFRVGIAYVIAGWLLAQVADLAADAFNAPEWIMQMLIVVLLIGLPVALFLAWAFELTPEGVVKAKDLPEDAAKDPRAGKRLNALIMVTLIVAVAWLGWDKLQGPDVTEEVTVTNKSIAVLPFADFSPDGEQGWFADGLTDEILNALARTVDLRVASRTSSFAFRDSELDVPTIAAQLGVAHILEGSVRRAGDRLRITAQLIRTIDDVHVWSDTFDGTTQDSIEIQEQIALKIANALETAMDPAELKRMLSAGTESVEAWELYLRADADAKRDNTSISAVMDLLEQATTIDPEFVDAHIAIAGLWLGHLNPAQSLKFDKPISKDEARQRFYDAIAMAERFARSDTARAEYQALRARFDIRLRDYEAALRRVSDDRPEDYRDKAALTSAYILLGDYDTARIIGNQAKALAMAANDPSPDVFQYLHRVDLTAALEMANAAVARPNIGADTLYQAHRVLLYAGEIEHAARLATLHNDRSQDLSSNAMVSVRQACAEGRVDDADRIFARLESIRPGSLSDNTWLFLQTLGRQQDAIDAVRYLDEGDGLFALSGFMHYTHFDPRQFPNLMAKLDAQGIKRPPATEIPFACKRQAAD